MSLFANIIYLIGFITFCAIVYYFYKRYSQHLKKQKKLDDMWPPRDYMKNMGAQCPDYWIMQPSGQSNTVKCVNKFNIPTAEDEYCSTNNVHTFNRVNKWPLPKDSRELKERCRWIQKCGPERNIPASWTGMDNYC